MGLPTHFFIRLPGGDMKKKRVSLWTLGLVAVFLFVCIPGDSFSELLKVGVLDFPPYYVVKSESNVTGSLTAVIRKTLERAGIPYELNGFPPKRLYKNLGEGVTHVFLGTRGVPEYDGQVLYSSIKVEEIEVRLYTLRDKPLLKTLQELKGKQVITQRGYGYGGMVTFLDDPANGITVDPTDGHELAFKKLIKGRADYLLDYMQPAEAVIKNGRLTGLKFSRLKSLSVQFIVSKKVPDAENLLKKIDAAYLALKKEGAFKY